MEENNAKIDYDHENDILYFSKAEQVKESIDIDDFIIDINHDSFVTGIEILNATENLNVSKKQLSELKHASMKVIYKHNSVYITLVMQFTEGEKDVTIPFAVNLGHAETTELTKFAIA